LSARIAKTCTGIQKDARPEITHQECNGLAEVTVAWIPNNPRVRMRA
jgi:hypothetical protein